MKTTWAVNDLLRAWMDGRGDSAGTAQGCERTSLLMYYFPYLDWFRNKAQSLIPADCYAAGELPMNLAERKQPLVTWRLALQGGRGRTERICERRRNSPLWRLIPRLFLNVLLSRTSDSPRFESCGGDKTGALSRICHRWLYREHILQCCPSIPTTLPSGLV